MIATWGGNQVGLIQVSNDGFEGLGVKLGRVGLEVLTLRTTELRARLEQMWALRDELLREKDQARAGTPTGDDLRGPWRELMALMPKVVEGEPAEVERSRGLVRTFVAQVHVDARTFTVYYALPITSHQVVS